MFSYSSKKSSYSYSPGSGQMVQQWGGCWAPSPKVLGFNLSLGVSLWTIVSDKGLNHLKMSDSSEKGLNCLIMSELFDDV